MLDVRLDVSSVSGMLTALEREVMPRATTSALNKTASKVQSVAIKLIAKDIGVPQKRVRAVLHIQKATWASLSASISPEKHSKGRIKVSEIRHSVTSSGVSFVSGGETRQRQGAFRATNPGGHTDIFQRTPGKYMSNRPGQTKHSEAIKAATVVTIDHVMIKDAIEKAMQQVAEEAWGKNFPHEVEFALRKEGYVA